MRYSCFRTDMLREASRLLHCLTIACAATLLLTMPTHARDRKCSLVEPSMSQKDAKTTFQIRLKCGSSGTAALATNKGYVVGLTLYALQKAEPGSDGATDADMEEQQKLRNAGPGRKEFETADGTTYKVTQKALPASNPGRRIISDDIYGSTTHGEDPFDFAAQNVRVKDTTDVLDFQFTADSEKIAGHNHFLFALWPASQKKPCNAKDEGRRSGCVAFGYVFGDAGDVKPVDFYPGLATLSSFALDGANRWIVESFR